MATDERTEAEKQAINEADWLAASMLAASLQSTVIDIIRGAGTEFPDETLLRGFALALISTRIPRAAIDQALDAATLKLQPALKVAAEIEEKLRTDPVLQDKVRRAGTVTCTCGSPRCPGTRARA